VAGSVITIHMRANQENLFLARWLLRPVLDIWRNQTGVILNINHP